MQKLFFIFIILSTSAFSQSFHTNKNLKSTPKSDVFLQGFYWNSTPGGIWYDSLAKLAPSLASAGFGAVWFPSPAKGMAGGYSMGYDPYDHYDFGEYNQSGSRETRFGSRQELINVINTYHSVGIQVFADAVLNHMNGGEQKIPYECKPYPSFPDSSYLLFNYPFGSGRFKKNASHFYPNLQYCSVNPPYHGPSDPAFQFGEWLAHEKQNVRDSLIVWGQYLRQVLGFDGFRIDAVKHIDPIFIGPWLQQANPGGYAVAEYFGGTSEIATWLHYCQNVFGGDVSMFDFPLRFTLKDICDNISGTFDMNWLDGAGLINSGISGFDVATFVDNHDFDRIGWDGSIDVGHSPIVNNKEMAYAYINFSEGRPSVWFKDYYTYGLKGKIDTLIWIRQNFLWGGTTKRSGLNPWYVGSPISQAEQSRDIFVARRNGGNGKPQAFLVMNDNPTQWRGVWVNSNHPNQIFRDFTGVAIDKQAAADGRVELWAPPRGYAIYIPDTTQSVNHHPYIQTIPDLKAFINSSFEYQINYGDPNNDPVTLSLISYPIWLNVSNTGILNGTPSTADAGVSTVVVIATDTRGLSVTDSFQINVHHYPLMDGVFDGDGIWGSPIAVADTNPGWASAMAKNIHLTEDQNYFYIGASVKAYQSLNWAFLINTKPGGGSSESWGKNIIYSHPNLPDYIFRGDFTGYAEVHTWTGSFWNNVGSGIQISDFGENIVSDVIQEGWVEIRILKSAIGNPSVFSVQFYVTGNQNANATFDACPNDENTTAWSGVITRLRKYAIKGERAITHCNLHLPANAMIFQGQSVTIYGRAFGIGITDTAGQASGLTSWIGYNTANTNPASWTNWLPAIYNADVNNYDEYRLSLGSSLTTGTYYYATRYQYEGNNFVFGGYSTNGGGFWDGTINRSGVLTILGPPSVPTLVYPDTNANEMPTNLTFQWNASASATSYRLQISIDSNFVETIFDDSTITTTSKYVSKLPASTRLFWRVRGKNSYGSGSFSEVRKFTTRNETTAEYVLMPGWNMISLPMIVTDGRKNLVFPSSISSAYFYRSDSGYVTRDTLKNRAGYWLKFAQRETVSAVGTPILTDTIFVDAGWNMIGSISQTIPVGQIVQSPANIISSKFYSYENGYRISDVIEPGRAYWIKCRTAGQLIINSTINKLIKKNN